MKCWLIAVIVLLNWSCRAVDCDNEIVIDKLRSPDGERVAFVFSRSCGATVGTNAQVSLLEVYQELPNDHGGNVFICDAACNEVKIQWIDPHLLEINYPNSAQVVLKRESWDGAKIRYVPRTQTL
jgi:hypothetical protein